MAWTTVFISVMPWKSMRPIGAWNVVHTLKLLRSKKNYLILFFIDINMPVIERTGLFGN
jgi:hypothetical protein